MSDQSNQDPDKKVNAIEVVGDVIGWEVHQVQNHPKRDAAIVGYAFFHKPINATVKFVSKPFRWAGGKAFDKWSPLPGAKAARNAQKLAKIQNEKLIREHEVADAHYKQVVKRMGVDSEAAENGVSEGLIQDYLHKIYNGKNPGSGDPAPSKLSS